MKQETKLDIIEIGRGYLGVLIISILMATGVVSGMYAGETISFETNFTNPVYTVVDNMSSLEGLNITFDNGNINITPALNYKPDNFTLIFFDNLTREVIKTINTHSRGSSKLKYVDNNVIVYVPEYINTTEIVEVEKVVDNTTVIETGYELWHVLFGIAIGIIFGWIMNRKKSSSKQEASQ